MRCDCTGKIVARTARTTSNYRERYRNLRLMAEREDRAGGDIVDVVNWFCSQNGRWSASTVRQYKAAIACELEVTSLYPTLRELLEKRLDNGPAPKVGGPKRTSAKKRKSLTMAEFARLDGYLKSSNRADDWLLRGFFGFGVALFLRPVEYLSTRVEGTIMIVENAKATNGRANGEQRKRDIAALGAAGIAALGLFLRRLKKAAAAAQSWQKLHNRLASRLARVCEAAGISRVSLYTLRHVGMATAKTWMEPQEVAAAAGHGSVQTATSHYAKRRTGWHGIRLAGKPLPESIAAVKGRVRFFPPQGPTTSINMRGP